MEGRNDLRQNALTKQKENVITRKKREEKAKMNEKKKIAVLLQERAELQKENERLKGALRGENNAKLGKKAVQWRILVEVIEKADKGDGVGFEEVKELLKKKRLKMTDAAIRQAIYRTRLKGVLVQKSVGRYAVREV